MTTRTPIDEFKRSLASATNVISSEPERGFLHTFKNLIFVAAFLTGCTSVSQKEEPLQTGEMPQTQSEAFTCWDGLIVGTQDQCPPVNPAMSEISCLLPLAKDFERAEYVYETDTPEIIANAIKRLMDVGDYYPVLGLDIFAQQQWHEVMTVAASQGIAQDTINMIVVDADTPMTLNGMPYAKIVLRLGDPQC